MKKVKNTTGSTIQIQSLGISVLPGETMEAVPGEYDLWTYAVINDTAFISLVNSGDLQVYDNVGILTVDEGLKHLRRFQIKQNAKETPFDPTNITWTTATDTETAIKDCYLAAKGIKTFPFELHYVSGTGLNTNMSNGAFFRVRPGTFNSGSFSGYPAAFPLQMPFDNKLYSIVLTFRQAAFDFNSTPGPLLFELEFRVHYYNGSDVKCRLLVTIPGTFSGGSTAHSTWRFELFSDNFSVINPLLPNLFEYGEMVGVRFVKAGSGNRRINSFRDIVMKLNFEEVI